MKKIILAALAFSLVGCDFDSDKSSVRAPDGYMAVLAGDDYLSSHLQFIDVDGDLYASLGVAYEDGTDIVVSSYEDHFYRIHRYQNDTITKSSSKIPDDAIWEYSTNDADTSESSNPYQLVFVDGNRAFLIRYGSSKLWLVNLAAENEEDFKIGEVDLSVYNDISNTVPNMSSGIIARGKLFVTLERLDSNWTPGDAYVAVIDVKTLTEVDTGKDVNGVFKGIPLNCKNPRGIQYHVKLGVVVNCPGSYWHTDILGGVDVIDPVSYGIQALTVGEGDTQINSLAIVDETLAFYVSYIEWGGNKVFAINPKTGALIQEEAVAGLEGKGFSAMKMGPDGHLWVATNDSANPGVYVVNIEDFTEHAFIPAQLPVVDFGFVDVYDEDPE